jgi:DNA-binding beta-propeller fold protein YncE
MRITPSTCSRVGRVAALLFLSLSLARAQSSGRVKSVLKKVADVPMLGPAVRFDYQSFDPWSDRLYIAHMNADQLVVFDTSKRRVVANLDGFPRVHGVTVAAAIHRVYSSATGTHQVVAVDTQTLKIVGKAGPIVYPDGLAYAPKQNKVFVSDEHGGVDAVIDAASNKLIASIPLGWWCGKYSLRPSLRAHRGRGSRRESACHYRSGDESHPPPNAACGDSKPPRHCA